MVDCSRGCHLSRWANPWMTGPAPGLGARRRPQQAEDFTDWRVRVPPRAPSFARETEWGRGAPLNLGAPLDRGVSLNHRAPLNRGTSLDHQFSWNREDPLNHWAPQVGTNPLVPGAPHSAAGAAEDSYCEPWVREKVLFLLNPERWLGSKGPAWKELHPEEDALPAAQGLEACAPGAPLGRQISGGWAGDPQAVSRKPVLVRVVESQVTRAVRRAEWAQGQLTERTEEHAVTALTFRASGHAGDSGHMVSSRQAVRCADPENWAASSCGPAVSSLCGDLIQNPRELTHEDSNQSGQG